MAGVFYPSTGQELQSVLDPRHAQPRTNPATNAPNAAQPYNGAKLLYDQRYAATFYKSDLYPEGLTPEWVNSHKANTPIKNGQVHAQLARWTPHDAWYMTNNWFHRINDRVPFAQFCGWSAGLHNGEFYDQPYEGHMCYSKRPYHDNIVGQTVGGALIGMQLGAIFGVLHTFNLSFEANIYQTIGMPPNRWLPRHKATFAFRKRVFASCVIQSATFLASYQFVEGCMSQLRGTDDFWNQLIGGGASGFTLYAWFRNPVWTTSVGVVFGAYMAFFRYRAAEWTQKPGFDINKPLFGIFGGLNNWVYGIEPSDGQLSLACWIDNKYGMS